MLELLAWAALAAAGAVACARMLPACEPWAAGCAALLGCLQALGGTYRDHGTFRALYLDPGAGIRALAVALLCGLALWLWLRLAFAWADRAGSRSGSLAPRGGGWRRVAWHAALLLLAWAPYLIIFAPGSFTWDGVNQMDVYHGFLPRTNHHPYLMTLLMGSVFDAGRALGSDSLGVGLWVALQTLVQAAAFALSLRSMRRMGAPRAAELTALAFFALAPAWGAYAQAFCKDTLYASLMCLYVSALSEGLLASRRGGGFGACRAAALALLGAGMALSRHNGAYAVALSLPPVLLALRGVRARLLAGGAAASALAAYALVGSFALPALGVAPAPSSESMGSLFQMTARYLRECPEDVTDGERGAIAAVLDYDALAGLYDPSTSDPVKATYSGDSAALPAYLRAWAAMGIRHPGVYLDSFLGGCYGYLYLDTASAHHTWDYRLYNQGSLPGVEDDFDVSYVFGEGVRGAAIAALNAFQVTPVLGLVGHCGIYTWLLAAACAYVVSRRRPGALAAVAPSAVMVLICLVSPVNGYLRYMLPVMAALPATLWFAAADCAVDRLGSAPSGRHFHRG